MKKFIFAISLLFSIQSFADSSVGCGLGSMIWKKSTIISALFRMTTNHSFSSQLFGITTGTSGCSRHSIVKNEMAPVYYAEANMENLRLEMAMGQGEYLDGFAATLGCPMSVQNEFNAMTKENYQSIFNKKTNSPVQMIGNLKEVMKNNDVLKATCSQNLI